MRKPDSELTPQDWRVIADALDQRILEAKAIERDLKANRNSPVRLQDQFKLIQERAEAVYSKLEEMELI